MQLLVIAMCNCCDYWAAVWGKDTSFTQLAHHRTPLVTTSLQGWTEGGPATTPCPSLSQWVRMDLWEGNWSPQPGAPAGNSWCCPELLWAQRWCHSGTGVTLTQNHLKTWSDFVALVLTRNESTRNLNLSGAKSWAKKVSRKPPKSPPLPPKEKHRGGGPSSEKEATFHFVSMANFSWLKIVFLKGVFIPLTKKQHQSCFNVTCAILLLNFLVQQLKQNIHYFPNLYATKR